METGDTITAAILLTGGDMVAQEVKYHAICLARYHTRGRKYERAYDGAEDGVCASLAFADLLFYVKGEIEEHRENVVLKMALLKSMYMSRLAQLQEKVADVIDERSTALCHKILAHFPELKPHRDGREWVLVCSGAKLTNSLDKEDCDDDTLGFLKYARQIRKSALAICTTFQGEFNDSYKEDCIPLSLLATINTILYGSPVAAESLATSPARSISQLIMFNMKDTIPKGQLIRNKKTREPPLPVYLALSAYGRN